MEISLCNEKEALFKRHCLTTCCEVLDDSEVSLECWMMVKLHYRPNTRQLAEAQ